MSSTATTATAKIILVYPAFLRPVDRSGLAAFFIFGAELPLDRQQHLLLARGGLHAPFCWNICWQTTEIPRRGMVVKITEHLLAMEKSRCYGS